jgi:hypothetical protein
MLPYARSSNSRPMKITALVLSYDLPADFISSRNVWKRP